MTDEDFLAALERCELPESEFRHTAHVRAAYLYLRKHEFHIALHRMQTSIRNYAAHLGKPDKYHETITVAFVLLIQQHLVQRGDAGGWSAFQQENPELLRKELLLQYYGRQQLESDLARRTFVLPRPAASNLDPCA